MTKTKLISLFLILAAAALAIFMVSLMSGSVHIPSGEIIKMLVKGGGDNTLSEYETILFSIRLPRVILAFIVGGALSLAGILLQAVFRNPLVEPYTLGISGGAGLLVSLTMMFAGPMAEPAAGFIGALASIFIVYFIGMRSRKMNMTGILLAGVMFSFICSSLVMLIISMSRTEQTNSILFWIMGNLGENNPVLIRITSFVVIISLAFSVTKSWTLNALTLGDEEAVSLGINVKNEKKLLFLLASLVTGVSVAVSGMIGFIGLLVPHIVRIFTGNDHRVLIPAGFILGGIFLMLSDTFARTVLAPVELPVGVVTGIIGGALFLFFLWRGNERI